MKHSADVTSHRFRSSINNLALYALENELSNDLIAHEIEKRFSSIKTGKKDKIMKDVIQSCYKLVWDSTLPSHNSILLKEIKCENTLVIESTIAITLASCIIETIQRYSIYPEKNKPFPQNFYSLCVEALLDGPLAHYDSDLLVIYCKQAVIMLKSAGIINNNSIETPNLVELYRRLFAAFWNKCNWKNLFPSGGYISNEIKSNRHLLLDIILSSNHPVTLDSIARTYFELTGIANPHDLFAISLLDFSVITWLSFFGIIEYVHSDINKPVTISLTNNAYQLAQLLFQ
ncbi:MAG: hypothetical protein N3F66_11005 [Spirochaetes bacterium]|nr:hypothetical protein [Spirochaetota bacterium]